MGVEDLFVGLHFFNDLMHVLKQICLQRLVLPLNKNRQFLHIPLVNLDNRLFLLQFILHLLLFHLHPIQLTNLHQNKLYSLQHKLHMFITLLHLHPFQ